MEQQTTRQYGVRDFTTPEVHGIERADEPAPGPFIRTRPGWSAKILIISHAPRQAPQHSSATCNGRPDDFVSVDDVVEANMAAVYATATSSVALNVATWSSGPASTQLYDMLKATTSPASSTPTPNIGRRDELRATKVLPDRAWTAREKVGGTGMDAPNQPR